MQMGYEMLLDKAGNKFDCVAGGETAGIAYAAWLADKYNLPMAYIRKKTQRVWQKCPYRRRYV